MAGSKQLVHSNYLQLLVALTVELGLHTALVSPPSSPHLVTTPTPNEWAWLTTFTGAVMLAESLSKRTALKSDVSFTLPADMKQLSQTEKFLPTVSQWLCFKGSVFLHVIFFFDGMGLYFYIHDKGLSKKGHSQ